MDNPFVDMSASEQTSAGLLSLGAGMFHGAKDHAVVTLSGDGADADTLTVNGVVFELDTDSSITAGNVAVDVSASVTNTDVVTALVTAINGNANCQATARDLTGGVMLIKSDVVGASKLTVSEVIGNGAITVPAGGGANRASSASQVFSRVPSAEEVTLGTMRFICDDTPLKVDVSVRTTATGAAVAWDGAVTVDWTNNEVTIGNGGAVDWAATDTVTVVVVLPSASTSASVA